MTGGHKHRIGGGAPERRETKKGERGERGIHTSKLLVTKREGNHPLIIRRNRGKWGDETRGGSREGKDDRKSDGGAVFFLVPGRRGTRKGAHLGRE